MKIEDSMNWMKESGLEVNTGLPLKESELVAIEEYKKLFTDFYALESTKNSLDERMIKTGNIQEVMIKKMEAIEVKIKRTGGMAGYNEGEYELPNVKFIRIEVDPISDEMEQLQRDTSDYHNELDSIIADFISWKAAMKIILQSRVPFIELYYFPVASKPELSGINFKLWQKHIQSLINRMDDIDYIRYDDKMEIIRIKHNKFYKDMNLLANRLHLLIQNLLELDKGTDGEYNGGS